MDLLVNAGIRSMKQLLEMVDSGDSETLVAIKGFGKKTVDSLFAELSDAKVRERIARLELLGLQFSEVATGAEEMLPQIFRNQVWCVTGSFERFAPRSLALKEIEARGGRTTSSVTSKTSHLLAGTGAGSKLQQAQSFGTTIVDEQQFIRMLEGGESDDSR